MFPFHINAVLLNLFYSSNNPEKKEKKGIILSTKTQLFSTIFIYIFNNNNKTCLLSIKSALEWFLKEHVTLKTGVMVHYFKVKYILKYIKQKQLF